MSRLREQSCSRARPHSRGRDAHVHVRGRPRCSTRPAFRPRAPSRVVFRAGGTVARARSLLPPATRAERRSARAALASFYIACTSTLRRTAVRFLAPAAGQRRRTLRQARRQSAAHGRGLARAMARLRGSMQRRDTTGCLQLLRVLHGVRPRTHPSQPRLRRMRVAKPVACRKCSSTKGSRNLAPGSVLELSKEPSAHSPCESAPCSQRVVAFRPFRSPSMAIRKQTVPPAFPITCH